MDQEVYDRLYLEMTTNLPSAIEGAHRQSMKRRLEFGNEISFRRRLTDLVSSLPDELREPVTGVRKGIPESWVDTRNYYTHWPESLKSKTAEGIELYCLNVRLALLLRILLLRTTSLSVDSIFRSLRGRSRWARELEHVAERERMKARKR
jgi:ApeA N-terminal domain 1